MYYRLQKGVPEDETLAKLARALDVPAPRIEMVFVAEPVTVPAETPLSVIREAQVVLERAAALIEEMNDADQTAASGDNKPETLGDLPGIRPILEATLGDPAATTDVAKAVVRKAAGKPSPSKKKGSRRPRASDG